MKKIKLGSSTLEVAPLAFGGNVLGWTVDEKTSFRILDLFIEQGFNLIDTADYYARWAGQGGESETVIGKWMKARNNRTKIIIATKVGQDMGQGQSLAGNYIRKAVEDSLRRLQTDHIDLYQSHKDDLKTPVEETLSAYAELVKAGKVRYIGASNFSPERLSESVAASKNNGWPAYQTLQPLYNLCERPAFEGPLQGICKAHHLSVLPYYALASGFLTGKYRTASDASKSVRGSTTTAKYLNEKGFGILNAVDTVSKKHKVHQAAIAIAWLLAQPAVAAPITSATSEEQLLQSLAGTKIQLDEEDLSLLNSASK